MSNEQSGSPLLSVYGVHKRFPGVHALRGVQLEVRPGEVHALVGENGAGKSTLMHVLAGVHQPDEGSISFNGVADITIPNEEAAHRLGIAIVFQERSLFGSLNVAENIFAARQPVHRFGRIDRTRLYSETRTLLDRIDLGIDPKTELSRLSPAQQQMVEIAKALSLDARLILFDEPTAALTATETRALFRVIGQLRAAGVGIIYISHRLEEVFQIAQRVTVLKDGAWQGTFEVPHTTPGNLIARMVGRDLALHSKAGQAGCAEQPVLFEVRGLTDSASLRQERPFLRGINLQLRQGEIVVLAGLAGAGRTELALSIFGARPRARGTVLVQGQPVRIGSPADAIVAGIGYASEDRKEAGLFLDRTIAENVVAAQLRMFGRWWMDEGKANRVAEEYREKLRIQCRGVDQPVESLSGGNQQKIVLAKWLLANPRVLIVDEPTRGIDVGAKAEVHQLLRGFAQKGGAVIVISSDLPEVLAIADRVMVMREGRMAGELSAAEATEERVLRLAVADA